MNFSQKIHTEIRFLMAFILLLLFLSQLFIVHITRNHPFYLFRKFLIFFLFSIFFLVIFSSRKNSLVVRTQLSVRVHAIVGKYKAPPNVCVWYKWFFCALGSVGQCDDDHLFSFLENFMSECYRKLVETQRISSITIQ